jgi:hypothetical protein
MTRTPDRRLRVVGAATLLLAVLLTMFGAPATSAQGQTLYVADADELPLAEPWSSRWDRAPVIEVALSAQAVTVPATVVPSVGQLRVRALTDDRQLAVLVEWRDSTLDESVLRVEDFADAVALQFAQGAGISLCMGQQAGGLNIWHWKADWAADQRSFQDVADEHPNMPTDATLPRDQTTDGSPPPGPTGYLSGRDAGNLRSAAERPSSVEDLNAVGFGTLTPQLASGQNVAGTSEYRDGTWRVVMSRSLATEEPDDAVLRRDRRSVIAFAIWDGSQGDRDGQKSVSAWLSLSFGAREPGIFDIWPFLLLLVLVLGVIGAMMVVGARQPAAGVGWPGGRPPGSDAPTSPG